MRNLDQALDAYIQDGTVGHIAVRVGIRDEILCDTFRGGVDGQTRFDMASVTKLMATTPLALMAIEEGRLSLDDPVSKFYPTDKPLTVWHLLTHTKGIGHKKLNLVGNTYENIAERILEIPEDLPIGTDVLYSCPGFILLGKIIEKIYGKRLDVCFDERIAAPLGLTRTSFLPRSGQDIVNANLTEELRGTVNDYNCQFLGGVAGNAGLFSNLSDVTKFVHALLRRGKSLFGENIFSVATRNHTEGMSASRGLGFLYVDTRYRQTGGLFEDGAVGHCGHTGQSVFWTPEADFT